MFHKRHSEFICQVFLEFIVRLEIILRKGHVVRNKDSAVHQSEKNVARPTSVLSFRTVSTYHFVESVDTTLRFIVEIDNIALTIFPREIAVVSMHSRQHVYRLVAFVPKGRNRCIL